jgi:DNA-binding transcriptional ArsR family regulator
MQLMVNKGLPAVRPAPSQDSLGVWLGPTCDFLCDLSRKLDGDAQKALILLVLFQARARPGGGPMRAAHLAATTGVPRETVRRKLAALAEQGLVERDSRRRWMISPAATNGHGLHLPG